MRRKSTQIALVLGLLFVGSIQTRGADDKPALQTDRPAPVVLLFVSDTPTGKPNLRRSMLLRETIRQGVLNVVRDELGLSTRDPLLWEFASPKSRVPVVRIDVVWSITEKGQVSVSLGRRDGSKRKELWNSRFQIAPKNKIVSLVNKVEAMSRKEFLDALKKAELTGNPHRVVENAPVPTRIESLLGQWNFIAQFAAVRGLHAEIRRSGESPQLLAALARGYANLGTLTESFWSPAHKGFKARALLYAQRLVVRTNRSPSSLWNRAYVRALIGLHRSALADLQAADKAAATSKSDASSRPEWVNVVKAFVLFDEQSLKTAADKKGPEQALARYLQMLAIEFSGNSNQLLRTSGRVLQVSPDCFRAMDMMSSIHAVGLGQVAIPQSMQRLSSRLYVLLPAVPSLPKSVLRLIESGGNADPNKEDGEPVFRVKLMKAMRTVGLFGTDRDEPSLAVLAELIQDVTFVQSVRLLRMQRDLLGVETRDTIEALEPINAGHPLAAYLRTFMRDTKQRTAATKQLLRALFRLQPYIESTEDWAIFATRTSNSRLSDAMRLLAIAHSDEIFRDYLRLFYQYTWGRTGMRLEIAHVLADVSPHSPQAVSTQIESDWKHAAVHAVEWEKKYRGNAQILRALAKQHRFAGHRESAIRCWKAAIRIDPTYADYASLAHVYKSQKKTTLWRETLEESLKLPAKGLEHARARVDIANDYMRRKQWEKARPYADAAARSYAAWALITASECHTGLKDWKIAEAYARAESLRYRSDSLRWFLWCHRTGHGDVAAAREHARKYLESLDTPAPTGYLQYIAAFYVLTDEPDKAFEVYRVAFDKTHNLDFALHAALLADQLHRTKQRDALLKAVVQKGRPRSNPRLLSGTVPHFANMLLKNLAAGQNRNLDLKAVDKFLKSSGMLDLTYFVGRYLANRGKKQDAVKYLMRVAESTSYGLLEVPMAAHLARKLKASRKQ